MKIENELLIEVDDLDIVNGEFIIPDSVTKINSFAFNYCSKLELINVNKDNKYYCSENGVLFNKDKTKLIRYPQDKKDNKYIIPNSVTEISSYAFYNCVNLIYITIPFSVIKIGRYSFSYSNNLESIMIPNSISKIGYGAFYNCKKLQSKKGNYKAFKKGLICNEIQFIPNEMECIPNEWNKIEGDIMMYEWGLHYVTNLFDIFTYYYDCLEESIEIWEIEAGYTVIYYDNEDSQKVTNAIKPIKKLNREEIINILNNK